MVSNHLYADITLMRFIVNLLSIVHSLQLISGIDGSLDSKLMPPTLLAAEKEEAKAVLTLFLKKQGLSNAVAARTINKSDDFIDHLVSRLHSKHKSRYLVGSIATEYCSFIFLSPFSPANQSLLDVNRKRTYNS